MKRVRCVNPRTCMYIHSGAEYDVLECRLDEVLIKADDGKVRWYDLYEEGLSRFDFLLEMATDKTNPKTALGATKPMLGLNPRVALLWMAKAFEFGAHGRDANGVQVRPKGYGEYNWRLTEIAEMVYVHAMERHIADYLDGEDVASDSKVKHLGHIMACCAILLDAEECGTLVRNRPPKGKAADLIERLTIKTQ